MLVNYVWTSCPTLICKRSSSYYTILVTLNCNGWIMAGQTFKIMHGLKLTICKILSFNNHVWSQGLYIYKLNNNMLPFALVPSNHILAKSDLQFNGFLSAGNRQFDRKLLMIL